MATNTSMESQISKGEWRKTTESEEPNPPDARSIYWVLTPLHAEHRHFSNVLDNTLLNVLKIKNDGYKPWDAHKNTLQSNRRDATVDIFF
ncbi:12319_t:CDS:2 [Funneliformis mosseae]|uniref:12319_t:CDS:1 n=1 Tax=Funneliformis mosseae TaxID=27381 RepID=A0A9N8ZD66_FUNMO|nr:12319_t:CDS:2 [Funneliformis mosseae]